MISAEKNMSVDRLRSYSSAFSRSVISSIIRFSDFTRLDWLSERYDGELDDCTYLTYLSYIYKTLSRFYRCEYVYKNEIINQLLLKKYGTKHTVAFNEFKVGDSIVDFAMMNGESKAFEIKTSLDSPRRLKKQMDDYRRLFNRCYIVVDESEFDDYAESVDDEVGIVTLSYDRGHIRLEERRAALLRTEIDPHIMMKCLRTCEYEDIVRTHTGALPDVPAYDMYGACEESICGISHSELNHYFLEEVKKRNNAIGLLQHTPKELRQMVLSMNLSKKEVEILLNRLNNPINRN